MLLVGIFGSSFTTAALEAFKRMPLFGFIAGLLIVILGAWILHRGEGVSDDEKACLRGVRGFYIIVAAMLAGLILIASACVEGWEEYQLSKAAGRNRMARYFQILRYDADRKIMQMGYEKPYPAPPKGWHKGDIFPIEEAENTRAKFYEDLYRRRRQFDAYLYLYRHGRFPEIDYKALGLEEPEIW